MGKSQYWLGLMVAAVACSPVLHIGEPTEAGAAGESGTDRTTTKISVGGATSAAQGGDAAHTSSVEDKAQGGQLNSIMQASGGAKMPPQSGSVGGTTGLIDRVESSASTSGRGSYGSGASGGYEPAVNWSGFAGRTPTGGASFGGASFGSGANPGIAGLGTASGGAYPTGTTGPGPLLVAAYQTALSGYAFGDFNRDGNIDLALTAADQAQIDGMSQLIVIPGQGQGTFRGGMTYPAGSMPPAWDVATADFDSDGMLDLVVANRGNAEQGSLCVAWGYSEGRFSGFDSYSLGAASIGSGGYVERVAIAELSGDARPDLVALTGSRPTTVYALTGRSDGNFGGAFSFSGTINGWDPAVAIGDLDGDRNNDLALTTVLEDPNVPMGDPLGTLTVWRGDGDGTFTPSLTQSIGKGRLSLAMGDLNGDHKQDVAIAYYGAVSVLLGNGDGSFATPVDYPVDRPVDIAMGDLNADTALDLVALDKSAGTASVLLNHGDGTFASAVVYPVGYWPSRITVGDYTGDGKLDIAVARLGILFGEMGWVGILPGLGDGTFQVGSTNP